MILSVRAETSVEKLNRANLIRHSLHQIIACLSLLVVFCVFWSLKLTGIGIAGEAFCGKAEHVHSEECSAQTLICAVDETEGHVHTESCLTLHLICGQEESETHTHTAECQALAGGFGCGLTEAEGHVHTADCLTEATVLSCGQEACEPHIHSEECYSVTEGCTQEEHIHEESCYSDITADVETPEIWEATLGGVMYSQDTREMMIQVAQSQLGYTESENNFQVDELGVRRGYTRYGEWYGNPYGDWNTMFAMFCLEYAEVASDVPYNSGAESLRIDWIDAGLFRPFSEFSPIPGNILFLDEDGNGTADRTAVITAFEDEMTIKVIEGDLNNTVAETEYPVNDARLIGYGDIPLNNQPLMMSASPRATKVIATRTDFSTNTLTNAANLIVIYSEGANGDLYAIDGAGNAVPIELDENGKLYCDIEDVSQLYWTFTANRTNYTIKNVGTGRFMNINGDAVTGTSSADHTLTAVGNGARLARGNQYLMLDEEAGKYVPTNSQGNASVSYFGISTSCYVWLDGTNGGLRSLTGSPNTLYTVAENSTMTLPTEWQSPTRYAQKVHGWYDIVNNQYYAPGAEVVITGNTVFYADWVLATYDIGQFNAQVADTVSTNSFITTHMFDYNYLFNVQSSDASVTVNADSHSETWSMVTSGTVDHNGANTFDFIFGEADSGGDLSNPNNRDNRNRYQNADTISAGIYNATMGDILFAAGNDYDPETGTGILGKHYLGTADHLFQIMDDPTDPHYGYYYYDSLRNALGYNQSNRRFYVYEYLSATSDAIGNNSSNADFLPFNSPYANTNGNNVATYTYAGVDGEYQGVTHYRYETNGSSATTVTSEFAYGMRSDINFYLPNDPGTGGNKDLNGNDIVFEFSGDDDLWVLIDGVVVLDIGGIHQRIAGTINFSTGQVTTNGQTRTSLMDLGIDAGDHILTVLYLERGASMANCSIYFNLIPRIGLEIQKEDVLTQQVLNGAQFSVYEDKECTIPAELWESEEAYRQDLEEDHLMNKYQNTFTVVNGVAKLWGLGSGNTYYIKETRPPDADGYGVVSGLIELTVKKDGMTTHYVNVISDAEGNEPSEGFTVHAVRIDEETQTVYLTATNAPETVTETTTVQVIKKWEDAYNHSNDYIQAYLTVTDPDGSIRRIREVTLSDENDWLYTWTNLPKYDYSNLSEVQYGVEESYESGYYSTVRKVTQIEIERTEWAEATSFVNGENYVLKTDRGYLSTTSTSDAKLKWVDESTAQGSALATWTATISSGKVKLINGAGQILSFMYNNSSSRRYFFATTTNGGSNVVQTFTTEDTGTGFRFFARRNNSNSGTKYYLASSDINNSGQISTTSNTQDALILTPMKQITQTDIQPVEDWAYQITNTPLEANNETSLTVRKEWVVPEGMDATLYQEYAVTVRLLADGLNTGRSLTLNLKNNWQGSFLGLPYADDNGNVIVYTVVEVWGQKNWSVEYGGIETSEHSPPTYSTVITNSYHPGGPMLPSTGSAARLLYILCGTGILLGTLVYGIGSRRKRERRGKTAF